MHSRSIIKILLSAACLAASLVPAFGQEAGGPTPMPTPQAETALIASPAPASDKPLALLCPASRELPDGRASAGADDLDALYDEELGRFNAQLLSLLAQQARYAVESIETSIPLHSLAASGQAYRLPAMPDKDQARLEQAAQVLMPQIKLLSLVLQGEGENQSYQARVEGQVGLYDVRTQAFATVEFKGVAQHATEARSAGAQAMQAAARDAARLILAQAAYRPELLITEVLAGQAVIALGSQDGVMLGDLFAVHAGAQGSEDGPESARLRVRELRARYAFAEVVWAKQAIREGQRLVALPREPLVGSVMGSAMIQMVVGGVYQQVSLAGIGGSARLAWNEGMYWFRPLLELGFVVMPDQSFFKSGGGLPISLMGGVETVWRLGLFSIQPNLMGGAVFLVPLEEGAAWELGGIRVQIAARLALQIDDSLELFLEPGYGLVFSGAFFNGIIAHAGVIIH